jgi:hypothetical protein
VLRRKATISALLIAAALALLAWFWTDRQASRRALAAHMEKGKVYAARTVEEVGLLSDELGESSGLAVSRTQPGILWSHNDSGDGPNLYAIDHAGRPLAKIAVTNAVAHDWEDMASGPCPSDLTTTSSNCLFLADIGDNGRTREELTVYVVAEPRLDRARRQPPTVAAVSFRYRYPHGPDDSEAFAMLPSGDATIISKGRSGTIDFFRLSAAKITAALGTGQVVTADYDGNTGIVPDLRTGRLATGAAASLDGKTLVVRTYNEVFFYSATTIDEAGRRWQRRGQPCFLGDLEPQGEAIDYLDDETLLLTSERLRGQPAAIHRVRC